MSVELMASVFACGPSDQCRRFILIAIADNCDDFGFGNPSVELIAAKACCSTRTVIRQVEILEQEGWLRVVRHLVGRGNGYFIDIGKIGARLTPKSRLSDLHASLRRTQSAKLSHIFLPPRPSDTDQISGDNPQGLQVTKRRGQVTKTRFEVTPDVTLTQEPSLEPSLEPSAKDNQNPPTPPGGGDPDTNQRIWQSFLVALKSDLCSAPALHAGGRFNEIQSGQNDFDTCFREWWLDQTWIDGMAWMLVTRARDPTTTQQGVAKYRRRIDTLLRNRFSVPSYVRVELIIHEHVDLDPAA